MGEVKERTPGLYPLRLARLWLASHVSNSGARRAFGCASHCHTGATHSGGGFGGEAEAPSMSSALGCTHCSALRGQAPTSTQATATRNIAEPGTHMMTPATD